jgi:protein-tyrosine kinase
MSLIERAVSRLSGATPSKSLDEDQIASSGAVKARPPADTVQNKGLSKIEILTEKLKAADAQEQIKLSPSPAPSALSGAPREAVRIHLEAIRARGFVTPEGEQSQIGQEFRVIKRPLLANAFGRGVAAVKNGKRVMVTSAFPGEGKSFCAINLAMSIAAERDTKVLLVDADVARPSILRELGIQTQAGLMDLLVDNTQDLAHLVLPTNVEKLSILPAGRRHKQATEFLASASMSRLLEQISARYPDRIIIFDSPPLLVTTESRVLASYMGQVVVVVEAGRTPRESVNEALSTIESNEVVGLILNKAQSVHAGSEYRYSGYGYGSKI